MDRLADDVDGVQPTDEEHHCEGKQQNQHQGEETAHRDGQVGLRVVAEVAAVADTSAVPFRANGTI